MNGTDSQLIWEQYMKSYDDDKEFISEIIIEFVFASPIHKNLQQQIEEFNQFTLEDEMGVDFSYGENVSFEFKSDTMLIITVYTIDEDSVDKSMEENITFASGELIKKVTKTTFEIGVETK